MSVAVESADGVARVTLSRPDARNAIDSAMRGELARVFAALDRDDGVRVAILTGAGPAFCAGVDLKERAEAPHPLAADRVTAPLDAFGKPVVAAVNGPAVGGGLELALAADLRLASAQATFALPEVRIGSLPGSGGTQRLLRVVAPAVANRMLMTGEAIDAQEALRTGLVSDVFEPAELLPEADRLARRIAANAPLSLRAAKLASRAALGELAAGLTLERTLWGLLAASEDREEGRAAFRERRPPRFRGR